MHSDFKRVVAYVSGGTLGYIVGGVTYVVPAASAAASRVKSPRDYSVVIGSAPIKKSKGW